MTLRRFWLACLAGLVFAPTVAVAQVGIVPEDLLQRFRSTSNVIRFCINSASAIKDFDQAVGTYLADSLLVEPSFFELTYPAPPYPFEYAMTLPDEEFFIQITNHCDAVIGYPLPDIGTIPEWITPTRPYYLPSFGLALGADAPDSAAALPAGTAIGSRIGLTADVYLRTFVRSSGGKFTRRVYPTNIDLIRDLASGALKAGLIWEPAVALAAKAMPEAAGIRLVDPPFQVRPVQLTIVLPSNQVFLRQLLDPAIEDFRANELARLLEEYGLPPE